MSSQTKRMNDTPGPAEAVQNAVDKGTVNVRLHHLSLLQIALNSSTPTNKYHVTTSSPLFPYPFFPPPFLPFQSLHLN